MASNRKFAKYTIGITADTTELHKAVSEAIQALKSIDSNSGLNNVTQ